MGSWQGLRASFKNLFSRQPPTLDPLEAYQLWADTYDDIEKNALLFAESRSVRPLVESHTLSGKIILDAGCGTGRYFPSLQALHPARLVAFDVSSNMLGKAIAKIDGSVPAHLCVASIESIPYKPSTFDFIICTLVLGHVQDVGPVIAQLATSLKPGGFFIASMFHPFGQLLGWQRTFFAVGTSGKKRNLFAARYYKHLTSEYFQVFASCGLEITRMVEPIVDETLRPFYEKAGRLDLYTKYFGFPLLLVVEVRKK